MKTYNQIGIKTLFFVFAIAILSNCKKNKDMDFLLQNEWKVKSIYTGEKTLKAPSKNFREEAYILKFINNTMFYLHTSVNYAGGRYNIVSEGNINIKNYGSHTLVCCENDFDEQMMNTMNRVSNYYCKGNKLTFLTDKNEKIFFEKQ